MDENVEPVYLGVNFTTLRQALYTIFFGAKGADNLESENYRYIIPMQATWDNPLNQADAKDTYIQYWIERDAELTQDGYSYSDDGEQGYSRQRRVASVLLRFIGKEAESWSKVFYHSVKRKDIAQVWSVACQGEILPYIAPCVPIRIDYFGKSTSIAFDVRFKIYYDELLPLDWVPLEGIDIKIKSNINYRE